MPRIALGIEYDGSRYSGWQRQDHSDAIQAHVESALSKVANMDITVICAGRTDAGVHAYGQVIHFDTVAQRENLAWVKGANTYLPSDIRVLWSKVVPIQFDARKSALSRQYLYVIYNRDVSPGIMHHGKTWFYAKLDANSMHEAGKYLVGEHDFTSFRATQCQAKTPIRHIYDLNVNRTDDYITINVTANAFLHHMVRNIVGTLVQIGQGKFPPSWIKSVLQAKDRREAGVTAPPNGLYLSKVSYPAEFLLPTPPTSPWIL